MPFELFSWTSQIAQKNCLPSSACRWHVGYQHSGSVRREKLAIFLFSVRVNQRVFAQAVVAKCHGLRSLNNGDESAHCCGGWTSEIPQGVSCRGLSWLSEGHLLPRTSHNLWSVCTEREDTLLPPLPLLLRTSVLLHQVSSLMTLFNLKYFLNCCISKYSHRGG